MSAGIDDDKSSSKNRETDGNNFEGSSRKEIRLATLKVAESEQRDVGRKIARIDPQVAELLNITSGDALELSSVGKKTTVLSWPARSNDRDKG
jgi:transitional endoplasmic reticulum ATPase